MIRFLALFALLLSFAVSADTLKGKVVGVIDGDTIDVIDADDMQHRIRLAGIDAPERKQPYGQRSKQSLSELIFAKRVTVEFRKQDRYERKVGKILLDDADINLEQVRRGMAWHYKAYAKEQTRADRERYAAEESDAQSRKVGLWRDASPIPPWEFRHHPKE